jgi:hypothetical protein
LRKGYISYTIVKLKYLLLWANKIVGGCHGNHVIQDSDRTPPKFPSTPLGQIANLRARISVGMNCIHTVNTLKLQEKTLIWCIDKACGHPSLTNPYPRASPCIQTLQNCPKIYENWRFLRHYEANWRFLRHYEANATAAPSVHKPLNYTKFLRCMAWLNRPFVISRRRRRG